MDYRIIDIRTIEKETWEEWFQEATPLLQERILRFRRTEDRMCSLCGDRLTREMLSQRLSCDPKSLDFARTEKGKPYLTNAALHFNISHSGNFVACCVDKSPIGIDIEERRSVREALCKKLCSEEELCFVYPNGEFSSDRFLLLWTAKEAVLKNIGCGISPDLSNFPVCENGTFSYQDLRFLQKAEDGYILTIAYKDRPE